MINDPFQMQPELRYGAPVCDQVLTGRHFTIGYSWYFRQAKWVLEVINPRRRDLDALLPVVDGAQVKAGTDVRTLADREKVQRLNNFRADTRIPQRFRAALDAYKGQNPPIYDRGHLVASANHDLKHINNSETFLLSNMSPQHKDLNRGPWAELEKAVRRLDESDGVLETYVLTCPVFYFNKAVDTLGKAKGNFGVDIPIPHAFVKSVLSEDKRGKLTLRTFLLPNEKPDQAKKHLGLGQHLVKTYGAEQLVGGRFWDRITGKDLHGQKEREGKMW
jgi:endonuclease G, mitochondrial